MKILILLTLLVLSSCGEENPRRSTILPAKKVERGLNELSEGGFDQFIKEVENQKSFGVPVIGETVEYLIQLKNSKQGKFSFVGPGGQTIQCAVHFNQEKINEKIISQNGALFKIEGESTPEDLTFIGTATDWVIRECLDRAKTALKKTFEFEKDPDVEGSKFVKYLQDSFIPFFKNCNGGLELTEGSCQSLEVSFRDSTLINQFKDVRVWVIKGTGIKVDKSKFEFNLTLNLARSYFAVGGVFSQKGHFPIKGGESYFPYEQISLKSWKKL